MWLFLACTGPVPVDSSQADADTDTDTVEDTVEDCGQVGDEDKDGLADCEDPDCIDVCTEHCTNGVDDDGDGAVDCDDDECSGEPACLGQWRLDVHVDVDTFTIDRDAGTLAAHGAIVVFGTPYGDGDAFTCTGGLSADDAFGTARVEAACDGCDARFDVAWSPFWAGECPLTPPLPTTQLGFQYDSAVVTRLDDSAWVDQYDAGGSSSIGSTWTLTDLEQQNVWSFVGYY